MPLGVFVPAQLNDLAVDVAVGTPAEGAVLYRGASKWNSLPVGTSGQFLKTQGAAADPVWSGLSSSDLSPSAILAPDSLERNRIIPTGNFYGLHLQPSVGQTTDLMYITDEAGGMLVHFTPTGNVGIGAVVGTENFNVIKTRTDISGTTRSAFISTSFSPASNSSANMRALQANIATAGAVNFTGTSYGMFTTCTHAGTGSMTTLQGISATVLSTGGGAVGNLIGAIYNVQLTTTAATVSQALGIQTSVFNLISGGVITTGWGIQCAAPSISAGGSIGTIHAIEIKNQGNALATTSYALRIANQTSSGTNWAINSAGGASLLQAGTATVVPLTVQGAASQSADILDVTSSGNTVLLGVGSGGIVTARLSDATTNVITDSVIIDHLSSGTPAAGFGQGLRYKAKSSTTASRNVGLISTSWVVATDASRTGRMRLWTSDATADREGVRLETDGTNAMVGFLGASAIARPSAYTLTGSATRTFPADPSSAYTGAADGEAKLADLNTLRGVVSSLLGVMRQMATDLGSTSGYGLLNA